MTRRENSSILAGPPPTALRHQPDLGPDADRRTAPPGPPLSVPAATALTDLLQFLHELHDGLKALTDLAAQKLQAIRSADAAALQDCARREEDLLKEVLTRDQQKAAILARFAQSLQRPDLVCASLTKLADALPEPGASRLRARSEALRAVALDLQRKNRVVALVAHNLQGHIRGLFAELAKAAQESVVYDAHGQQEAGVTRSWVEAVG